MTFGGNNMVGDLETKLESVCDEESFLVFVSALAADRADEQRKEIDSPSSPFGSGANGWANISIEAFLESAVAWATASKRSSKDGAPKNPWKRCAEILYAGKGYE
jgi:hypothetical protein